jgi:hypothetical protein
VSSQSYVDLATVNVQRPYIDIWGLLELLYAQPRTGRLRLCREVPLYVMFPSSRVRTTDRAHLLGPAPRRSGEKGANRRGSCALPPRLTESDSWVDVVSAKDGS